MNECSFALLWNLINSSRSGFFFFSDDAEVFSFIDDKRMGSVYRCHKICSIRLEHDRYLGEFLISTKIFEK